MSSGAGTSGGEAPSPLREIVQPFIDVVRAPRALWGINFAYFLEGMVYFGMLGYLAIHFSSFVFRGVEQADVHSHANVMVLTAGITLSMFLLGAVSDRYGVRFALISAFVLLLLGRVLISAAPFLFQPTGLWSPLHLITLAGILLVVVGYGLYQPAAYAGVRQFTNPRTAGMGFAMLYALMNLGGYFPSWAFLLRDERFLGLGIPGTFWVYTAITLLALLSTMILLTPATVRQAIADANEQTTRIKADEQSLQGGPPSAPTPEAAATSTSAGTAGSDAPEVPRIPPHLCLIWLGATFLFLFRPQWPRFFWTWDEALWRWLVAAVIFVSPVVLVFWPSARRWVARHPLADPKFFYFIFCLIPVQTLFTYNWLVLPQYISRAFEGWIGQWFEIASNANPILIFVLVPIIAALTQKARVYDMMIRGTFVMAAPAFLLCIGPYGWTLFGYILIMTVGEAMWQPRFLQYAAEIAPEGRTGEYMGVAQLPWFLTKVLVPLLYSGWMMDRYCPAEGPKQTEFMWFVFGCIAIVSPVLLLAARGWIGRDFKSRAA